MINASHNTSQSKLIDISSGLLVGILIKFVICSNADQNASQSTS